MRLVLRLLAAAAVFALVQVGALAIAAVTILPDLQHLRAETGRLENSYLWASHFAAKRAQYLEQAKELERELAYMRTRVPDEVDREFLALKRAAAARGLRVEVEPAVDEVRREFYAELPARLSVIGPFHAVAGLMQDVTRLPGSVRLAPFAIERAPNGRVILTGTVRTFRYLSDAEVEAQRKALRKKDT